jgi:hypothetical protein
MFKDIIFWTYAFVIWGCFLYIWIKHCRLVRKLNTFIESRYSTQWEIIKEKWPDFTWQLGMKLRGPYPSRAIYNFIWRSKEDFGDEEVRFLKGKVRQIRWKLSLFFFVVILSFILFAPLLDYLD